jgi:hypothetical protein
LLVHGVFVPEKVMLFSAHLHCKFGQECTIGEGRGPEEIVPPRKTSASGLRDRVIASMRLQFLAFREAS